MKSIEVKMESLDFSNQIKYDCTFNRSLSVNINNNFKLAIFQTPFKKVSFADIKGVDVSDREEWGCTVVMP